MLITRIFAFSRNAFYRSLHVCCPVKGESSKNLPTKPKYISNNAKMLQKIASEADLHKHSNSLDICQSRTVINR